MVSKEKPTKIITVGDAITKCLWDAGLIPDVFIVDSRIKRKPIIKLGFEAKENFHIKNPPGTLTDEAFATVRLAVNLDNQAKVVVDGEEDLLTLLAVLFAPENSFVMYGQPDEGAVIIRVTDQKRKEIRSIIEDMEDVPSKS